jgi:hypothetical protein
MTKDDDDDDVMMMMMIQSNDKGTRVSQQVETDTPSSLVASL